MPAQQFLRRLEYARLPVAVELDYHVAQRQCIAVVENGCFAWRYPFAVEQQAALAVKITHGKLAVIVDDQRVWAGNGAPRIEFAQIGVECFRTIAKLCIGATNQGTRMAQRVLLAGDRYERGMDWQPFAPCFTAKPLQHR